jgi:hypothetical protein
VCFVVEARQRLLEFGLPCQDSDDERLRQLCIHGHQYPAHEAIRL